MKAIPIRRRNRRQGMGAAVKAGIVLVLVAALCLELIPLMHGSAETAAALTTAVPSPPSLDFVPNRLPDRAQIERMEIAEPLPTF